MINQKEKMLNPMMIIIDDASVLQFFSALSEGELMFLQFFLRGKGIYSMLGLHPALHAHTMKT
jgi:hypothetical protein